jgi:drug/metabolite transporter (DMT)-like permease
MSWAIVIASPAMLLYGWFMIDWSAQPLSRVSPLGWGAAAYLMLVSQSMGMFLWNRVLARGSIPKLSLLQLLQPFFTLGIATAFLGEHASWPAWAICALVALGIWGAYREKGLVRPRV